MKPRITFGRLFVGLAVCVSFTHQVTAAAEDLKALEARLKGTYRDKVVTLRNFYESNDLRYDQNGQLVGTSKSGPWTVSGRVEVTDISLKPSEFSIAGNRLLAVYEQAGNKFTYIRTSERFTIRIAIDGVPTEAEIHKVMAIVFVSPGEFPQVVPAAWKSFLEKGDCATETVTIRVPGPIKLGSGVVQGKVISQPKPLYPSLARQARIQGTVRLKATINKQGAISGLCLSKPMGAGLDEAALEAVAQWRYQPYMLEGEPVEVETQITVNFNLSR